MYGKNIIFNEVNSAFFPTLVCIIRKLPVPERGYSVNSPPIKPAITDQNYRYIYSYFVIQFTFYDFHFRKYFHLGLCSIPYKEQPREYLLLLGFGLGSPAIYIQI
jgi:hypothetical protein